MEEETTVANIPEVEIPAMPTPAGIPTPTGAGNVQVQLEELMDGVPTNPIIIAAAPLLTGLVQLKSNPLCEDMHVLQQSLVKEVINFDSKAKQMQINEELIDNAHYVLCACFDELILNYCQDKSGNEIGQSSLISVFYHETSGGENVFVRLEKLMHKPSTYVDVLELYSLCLSMGFTGKYRNMERGFEQLKVLHDQLWRCIHQQRGDITKPLYAKIGVDRPHIQTRKVTLGMVLGGTVLVLALIGFGFNMALHHETKPAMKLLKQI